MQTQMETWAIIKNTREDTSWNQKEDNTNRVWGEARGCATDHGDLGTRRERGMVKGSLLKQWEVGRGEGDHTSVRFFQKGGGKPSLVSDKWE